MVAHGKAAQLVHAPRRHVRAVQGSCGDGLVTHPAVAKRYRDITARQKSTHQAHIAIHVPQVCEPGRDSIQNVSTNK